MRRFASLAAWILAACAPMAGAGGLRDLEDAWLVAPEAVVAMLADSTAGGGPWCWRLAGGRLYGMPELDQVGLGIARRWPSVRLAADWERLGRDLYREDRWSLDLLLGRAARLGVRVGAARLDLDGQAQGRRQELDLLVHVAVTEDLQLQARLPVTPAPPWYGETGVRRWLLVQGGAPGWLWAVAVDRDPAGRPALQGEILLQLAPRAALGLRCEPATGTVALSTAWRAPRLVLRSSHALHPDLGPSHRWGLLLGGGAR